MLVFRLGSPRAVAGLQPRDYSDPDNQQMARFWRWAIQQDASDLLVHDFIVDTVDLLYGGASLKRLQKSLVGACLEATDVYDRLLYNFSQNHARH